MEERIPPTVRVQHLFDKTVELQDRWDIEIIRINKLLASFKERAKVIEELYTKKLP